MRGVIFILTCLASAGNSWQAHASTHRVRGRLRARNLKADDPLSTWPSRRQANRRGTLRALQAFTRFLMALDPTAAFDVRRPRPMGSTLALIPSAKILCSLRCLPRAQSPFCCVGVLQDISKEGDGSCMMEMLSQPQPDGQQAVENSYAWIHFKCSLADGTLIRDSRAEGDNELKLLVNAPMQACDGVNQALMRMRVGERALVICEPSYGYGEKGNPPTIPANATLRWEIELLKVRDFLKAVNEGSMAEGPDVRRTEGDKEEMRRDLGDPPNSTTLAEQELPIADWFKDAQGGSGGDALFDRRISGAVDQSPRVSEEDFIAEASSEAPGFPKVDPTAKYWTEDATRIKMKHNSGYTLRETDTEIEVILPLPADVKSRRDVSVDIGARSIRVSVLGKDVIAGELVSVLSKDESSWTFSLAEGQGEPAMIQLDLMKKVPSSKDEPLWGYLLREELDAARTDPNEQ